jgi:hypothetical protein
MSKMDRKTIWNCHILDKLYWVHKQGLNVNDAPIISIVIHDREVLINNFSPNSDTVIRYGNVNFYLNKFDADVELIEYINSLTTNVNSTYYQKVLQNHVIASQYESN